MRYCPIITNDKCTIRQAQQSKILMQGSKIKIFSMLFEVAFLEEEEVEEAMLTMKI